MSHIAHQISDGCSDAVLVQLPHAVAFQDRLPQEFWQYAIWLFPKIREPILGVPKTRIIAY